MEEQTQRAFRTLKPICVSLLSTSVLAPSTIPSVLKHLAELVNTLRSIRSSGIMLNKSLISYIFFPLSSILKRNPSSAIPDQVLEKMFVALGILCDDWWWECELETWDQIFMLCGSVVGGIEAKGKGKDRDDETKAAAAQCLFALLRSRADDIGDFTPDKALQRLQNLREHATSAQFMPILGQTLNSILETAESRNMSLQKSSLDLVLVLLHLYIPDDVVSSVLPGVVSTMCKLALGANQGRGWASGEIVAQSLRIMQETIVKSIGDEVCIRDGILVSVDDLEDLTELLSDTQSRGQPKQKHPFGTIRSSSWLSGSSSQLHIALKSLAPLVKHPTASALVALANFASAVIEGTPRTLPQTQPLLLSFLLSLSSSAFERVSGTAFNALLRLLSTDSKAQLSLLQTLMRTTRDNLVALPLFLPTHADEKVEHIAGIIDTVCRLAIAGSTSAGLRTISAEIGKLLGPSGGIEKWGWSLLSVLEFVDPPVMVTRVSNSQLMLESDTSGTQFVPFPQAMLKNVNSSNTYDALVRMFHSLGHAAGDSGLSSVEWFANVGQSGRHGRAVAGIWCASKLLEGIAQVDISVEAPFPTHNLTGRSKRLEKFVRGLAKGVAQLWDTIDTDDSETHVHEEDERTNVVQHVKGLIPLHETLQITSSSTITKPRATSQPMLHKAFSLQLLSVTAGVLQSKFISLLMYTLYPVLHSIVSPLSFLSTTALASLNYITASASYASPGNLLLSNFDYVLDSISRRLSRRWLDVHATKVLVVMIHLVGNDIVERAGDVVEECFDRLDEYHGYEVIVEGIVEVLNEVIKVIKVEADGQVMPIDEEEARPLKKPGDGDEEKMNEFFAWFKKRNDPIFEEDNTDYGPAPRKDWGEGKGKGKDEDEEMAEAQAPTYSDQIPQTPPQALAKQMVTRSMYFLTHRSPVIRARILSLLTASVSVLPADALMPAIHNAWPFILNRLGDSETFVVSAAAGLVEALSFRKGSYMYRRIWDDVWPRFFTMLSKLQDADVHSALIRRGAAAVGTESIYTHSHRLYRSLLRTMTAAIRGVDAQDSSNWQVIVSFRRFLHAKASEELQQLARELYVAAGLRNTDAVWLALYSTLGQADDSTAFLQRPEWELADNVALIFRELD
ncbi:hypothetical protein V5O48_002549 [Marasmius crinis-equi]|uniref:Uncharacterized protein n=1 Tax=Marasmius crinis-equi TaxID=585013 RepID=A0ABR3FV99_9AGAR